MNITLKQLRYFEALARHKHFARAASTLSITQPALSLQIKDLEQELGVPLFERGPREVRLTAFGAEFGAGVRKILGSVEDLAELVQSRKTQSIGHLRLGIIPTIAPYLLPTVIRNLTEKYSGAEVHVRETQTSRLIEDLTQNRIDAAIVALPVNLPHLSEIPLFSEEFVLVRTEAEQDLPVPGPELLREMRLLLLEEGHCFRDQALSFCGAPAVLARETLDASSLSTLVQMVGAGIGITLIPAMAVPVETRSAPVSVARFNQKKPSRTVGMIWRKTSPLTVQFLELSEVVKDSAAELWSAA